jgi:ABC-type transport system involved in Fe-S cluster assembly fused permease/ATPase subunit
MCFFILDNNGLGAQIVDMFAAATYLAGALEPWVALIVFVTIGSYIPLTIIVTEWRGNFRREMNRTENARSARVTDALLNWWVCSAHGPSGNAPWTHWVKAC